ncbi:hypothetical protein HPB49_007990 [Dermacentor silvarum]|uniref:Uncharacterized protein n=1 Tax=Dermacentor silvarum TaxID=543639 RepID=A0ACB8CW93_DERSI|nr:hypothetical protein HPB49_007990 [Dermacentor silvarum]
MILKKRYFSELGGEILLDVPKRSLLSEDAIPCVFPSSSAHPLPASRKRTYPSTRHSPPPPKARNKDCKTATAATPQEDPAMVLTQEEDSEISPEPMCNETSKNVFLRGNSTASSGLFAAETSAGKEEQENRRECSGVCLDPSNAHLPNSEWNHHTLCDSGLHCFHFIQAGLSSSKNPLSVKILNVQQVKDATFTLSTFALGRRVDSALIPESCELRSSGDWSVVSEVLKDFSELKLCSGGPPQEKYADVYLECGYVDATGVWRHNRCSILQAGESPCKRLNNTLRMHKYRKEKRREEKRIRIPLKSIVKEKVNALRRQRINCYRSKMQALKTKRKLFQQLLSCRDRLKILSDDLLSETLTEANLSETQQMLVRECVEAARHQSKKGRRYTNNWLLLCLLLHIRSPSAYRFFRENDVLPLPSVKTIRRYISRVDMKCGFDKYFFSALKNKLQTKPTFSRHGTLLMDEMQVRQCKRFNSRTLTYDGFVDQGEQSMESPDLADHALVLMFCPFTDSYAQPVAVFASKNATRGTVLCQLLLQAIVLLEEAGAIIDGVVCDGASTNRTMSKHLGVSGDMEKGKHFFEHPLDAERNVYVFSDVPHLFKCIRNRLLKQKYLKVNGKWVKWSHYVSVLK